MLRRIAADIVFAKRLFLRHRGIAWTAVVGLAFAIGVSTAVFSVLDAVSLRGYGVKEPKNLYKVVRLGARLSDVPWELFEYRHLSAILQDAPLAAESWGPSTVQWTVDPSSGGDERSAVSLASVSGNYFALMVNGVAFGRPLVATDDLPGAEPVVVLSDLFAKSRFGKAEAVLGERIWLDGRSTLVVGVARRGFTGPTTGGQPPVGWRTFAASDTAGREKKSKNGAVELPVDERAVAAGPEPGVRVRIYTRTDSQRSTAAISGMIAATVNAPVGRPAGDGGTRQIRLDNAGFKPNELFLGLSLTSVAGAIVLILSLACANIAHLLTASAAARRSEFSTRLALGASGSRLFQQLLTESLALGAMSGLGGLLVAAWLAPLIGDMLGLTGRVDVSLDVSSYYFTLVVSMSVALIAGLAPVRHMRRKDLVLELRGGRVASTASSSHRGQALLVGCQAGASVMLVILAGLLTRGLIRAVTMDLGVETNRLVSVQAWFDRSYTSDSSKMLAYWETALDRVRRIPVVTGASLAGIGPFGGNSYRQRLLTSPDLPAEVVNRNSTDGDYFGTVGPPILRGRAYSSEDAKAGAPVAVISEGLAKRYWGTEDPIGSPLDRVWGKSDSVGTKPTLGRKPAGTLVVGVAANTVSRLSEPEVATIYVPMTAGDLRSARLVILVTEDPAQHVGTIRNALASVDPMVESKFELAREGVDRELEEPRALASLGGFLAATALGLAMLGIFGMAALAVARRKHELTVRIAMGAGRGAIVRLVLISSLKPVAVGVSVGVVGAIVGSGVLRANMFGISTRDPLTIASAVAILLFTASAACAIPTLQATRVNPTDALKSV